MLVEELERVRAELEQQRAELTATAEKLGVATAARCEA